ncbi:UDENN FLCN/SMCR8-type domain-containing protein [Aphelenchoides besseyi]|nr:UDENN FLCN/SMCR8-type domain-containing protein [Aphelenchoides besseyi]
MPQRLRDLLVIGKPIADPWHRIHYCDRSVLLFVEFCQAEGPKPICHIPTDAGPHLDLDNVSVWLMSAENFHSSRLMLYNQQMDLYALVYHITMLDITARGFQRPLALAFLSSERPTIQQRSTFKRLSHDLFRPFLACNRRLFCSYAERVVELANEIQRHKFHTYYSLQTDLNSSIVSTTFHKEFAEFYNEILKEDLKCGVLFSSGVPVLKTTSEANIQPTSDHDETEETTGNVNTSQISREFPNENSLSCFGSALTQCVYPLLAGEKMAILASNQRQCTGIDLLEKLNSLRVCRRRESAKWITTLNDTKYSSQLVGISCNKEEAQKWQREPVLPVYIDLNNHRLFSQHYDGKLLSCLRTARHFPSDHALILHLVSVISEICLIARVGRKVPLELIGKKLKLNEQDLMILANILSEYDLVKSIVFGRGKRPPNTEDNVDCDEFPSISSVGLTPNNPIRSPSQSPTHQMTEESDEEDTREAANETPNVGLPEIATVEKKPTASKRKTSTYWNTEEVMAFYDGIKEHGKNFEQIVQTLSRKKFSKDKDQVRNYYYNSYKMYKEKAGIEERVWTSVPHTARELLVIINALEWRKRTHTAAVNPIRFKTLIMTGTTTVKVQGKRLPVSIRTPNCPALHKFFPSMKQSAKVPTTLQIQLVPYTYTARRYVLNCEQNPLLSINVNTQSGFRSLFRFLEQKWTLPERKSYVTRVESTAPTIVLYPPEGFKPTKISVQIADDAHPSINSLRADCENRQITTTAGSSTSSNITGQTPVAQATNNVFESFDENFANGLTVENTSNASFLQLYYIFNQQTPIRLRYDVSSNVRSTNVFLKLSELIRNSEGLMEITKNRRRNGVSVTNQAPTAAEKPSTSSAMPPTKRRPNFRLAGTEATGTYVTNFAHLLPSKTQSNAHVDSQHQQSPPSESAHDLSFEETLDSFGFLEYRAKKSTNKNGKTFTNLQNYAARERSDDNRQSDNYVGVDATNDEHSRNILNSPSKSLQEAAWHHFANQSQQNSLDIVTNFSQLEKFVTNESSSLLEQIELH